jgi:hypothetical protein
MSSHRDLVVVTVLLDARTEGCLPPPALQVQEPEEEDAVYLRRQQAAVDEINKRGLTLFHASVQVRKASAPHACSAVLAVNTQRCRWGGKGSTTCSQTGGCQSACRSVRPDLCHWTRAQAADHDVPVAICRRCWRWGCCSCGRGSRGLWAHWALWPPRSTATCAALLTLCTWLCRRLQLPAAAAAAAAAARRLPVGLLQCDSPHDHTNSMLHGAAQAVPAAAKACEAGGGQLRQGGRAAAQGREPRQAAARIAAAQDCRR